MYSYSLKKLPKKTAEILLTIPKVDIEKERVSVFEKLQKELSIEGFRKGKVPKDLAEKHINKETMYQELLKSLLSRIYEEIIKKENLQPITSPKIELTKAKEGDDWEIKITLAEKPIIELGDYKETIKKLKLNQKKDEIWVPGKKQEKKNQQSEAEARQKYLNTVLARLLNEAKFELSDLILEEELDKRLTQLVDDVRKIGLTVESYLKSKNLTIDQLKLRFRKEIEDTYKLEFTLMEIADKERISVEKEDIDKLLSGISNEKERKVAEQNAYYYASILRKQKTLDFLLAL
jgi:trigger factor